jgi:thiol-disulfide isomerase/thioredoxin
MVCVPKIVRIVIALLLFSNALYPQFKKFELRGSIIGINNGKVELVNLLPDGTAHLKSSNVFVKNGKFSFKGFLSMPIKIKLRFNENLFSSAFFLEPGIRSIKLNIKTIRSPIVIPTSKANKEYQNDFNKKMASVEEKSNKWYRNYYSLLDSFHNKIPSLIDNSIENEYKLIKREETSILCNYVKEHSRSYVSLWHLKKASTDTYIPIYDTIYNQLDAQLKKSINGIALKKILDKGKKTMIGATFPQMNVVDSFGVWQKLKISKDSGYILIDFWFSGCNPCIAQFDKLKELIEKYKNKKFSIQGISVDLKKDERKWLDIIKQYSLTWPQFWDVDRLESEKLNINFFPMNFLLNNNGKIIKKNISLGEIEELLKLDL